jgi:hypothetical protein
LYEKTVKRKKRKPAGMHSGTKKPLRMNRSNGMRFTFSWYNGTEHTTSATGPQRPAQEGVINPEAREVTGRQETPEGFLR